MGERTAQVATLEMPDESALDEEALEAAGEAVRRAMHGRAHTTYVTFAVEHPARGTARARSVHARARSARAAVSIDQNGAAVRLRARAGAGEAQALLGQLAGALMTARAQIARREGRRTRTAGEGAAHRAKTGRAGLEALLREAERERGGYGVGVALGRAWEQGLRQAWEAGGGTDPAHPLHALLERAWTVLEDKARSGRRMWQCGPRHAGERRNAGRWMGWIAQRDPTRVERLWAAIDSHAETSAERAVLTLEAAQALMGEETRDEAGARARRAMERAAAREPGFGLSERQQIGESVRDLIAAASAAGAHTVLEGLGTALAAPQAGRAVPRAQHDALQVYAMRANARGEAAAWDAIVARAAHSAHPEQTVRMMLRTRTEPKLDSAEAHALVEALERGRWAPASAAGEAALRQIPRRLARNVHGATREDKQALAERAGTALKRHARSAGGAEEAGSDGP